jgi:hypothetical protein
MCLPDIRCLSHREKSHSIRFTRFSNYSSISVRRASPYSTVLFAYNPREQLRASAVRARRCVSSRARPINRVVARAHRRLNILLLTSADFTDAHRGRDPRIGERDYPVSPSFARPSSRSSFPSHPSLCHRHVGGSMTGDQPGAHTATLLRVPSARSCRLDAGASTF